MKVEYSKLNRIEEGTSPAVAENVSRNQLQEKSQSLATNDERPPPPGVKPGGVWGAATHCGASTKISSVLCCLFGGGCIPVCIHCCFPFDRRRLYKDVNGNIYNTSGELVCPKRDNWNIDFEKGELHYDNQINYDQRKYAWMFSGFIACIFWLLRIATMKY